MRWLTTIGFLLLTTFVVRAQDAHSFSSVEKEAFVAVFWKLKSFPAPADSVIASIFEDARLTKDRYAEIINSQLKGNPVKLSESDDQAVSRIRDVDESFNLEKAAFLNLVCAEYGLTIDRYNAIRDAYRSDITFQQSMLPYFKSFFKEQKQ